uniref:Uncharacterized protein n=1 Tax=Globodera rostochiensis TaxID=31243 RepID=A0A914IE80_GLORO
MEAVATFLALISIIAILGPSTGLKCKLGAANFSSETSRVGECPEDTYCMAFTCSREHLPLTAVIAWTCKANNDKKSCDAEAKDKLEKRVQATDFSCECTFGEKGKELANEKFSLPQLPEQNANDTRKFDLWGCAASNDCAPIRKMLAPNCNCTFDEKDEDRANQYLHIPPFLVATAWTDWKTGKDLGDGGAGDVPLTINPAEQIVISAKSIHGVVPDVIKLYFNGGTNEESRKMILNICVPRATGPEETCKDGLILCFVGQMDPANAPVITQFQLKNLKNNEIATKCENAQAKWHEPEFDGKKLHGFQIAHVEDKLLLSSSTSLETVACNAKNESCCEVRLGEPGILGGFVAGQPLNESETFVEKAWRGGLLRQENPVSALTFDLLGAIPQGGGLGIIADKCDMQITLEGDGLRKCLGKKCEGSNPEKDSAKTRAPKEEM